MATHAVNAVATTSPKAKPICGYATKVHSTSANAQQTKGTNMNTTTPTEDAEARGYARGANDALALAEKNDFPLSGEWAGESMTELIGDLIAKAENDEHGHEICMAYEEGYSLGYDDAIVEEILRMKNKD